MADEREVPHANIDDDDEAVVFCSCEGKDDDRGCEGEEMADALRATRRDWRACDDDDVRRTEARRAALVRFIFDLIVWGDDNMVPLLLYVLGKLVRRLLLFCEADCC